MGLADPQSLNSYSYVENNPIKYTDPTGKGPEVAIPIAFAAAYTPTFLGEYTSNIIANVQYGNYLQAFFPNSPTVAGFSQDALDAGGDNGLRGLGLAVAVALMLMLIGIIVYYSCPACVTFLRNVSRQ